MVGNKMAQNLFSVETPKHPIFDNAISATQQQSAAWMQQHMQDMQMIDRALMEQQQHIATCGFVMPDSLRANGWCVVEQQHNPQTGYDGLMLIND